MPATANPDTIRHDIFAIKVWSYECNSFVYEYMTYNRTVAFRRKRQEYQSHQMAKVVHPRQWVVDGYVAYGNKIDR